MLRLLTLCALVGGAVGQSDTRSTMEAHLVENNQTAILQWFVDHPDEALSFIDGYFEGGLKMIEEGQDAGLARSSYQTGVKFAVLADRAFAENIFSHYAHAFTNWNAPQQKQFREGQKKFRAGRAAEKHKQTAEALRQYTESLALAEPLGDDWGLAMAWGGIGNARLAAGEFRAARQAYTEAFWRNARLRLRHAQIRCLLGIARANAGLGAPHAAMMALRQAMDLLRSDNEKDKDLTQKVADQIRETERMIRRQTTSASQPSRN